MVRGAVLMLISGVGWGLDWAVSGATEGEGEEEGEAEAEGWEGVDVLPC